MHLFYELMPNLYFDTAATTPLSPEALEAMMPYLTTEFGNPSSLYTLGQRAHVALNKARSTFAKILGTSQEEVFFTGGATEAIHTVIRGVAHKYKEKGKHLITSAFEHSAVLEAMKVLESEGFEVTYIQPNHEGLIEVKAVEKALRPDTILASFMYVNNEVGTIQPIAELGKLLHQHNVFFHTDAAQAFAYLPCNMEELQVDAITLAPHKFYGPKGIGVAAIHRAWEMEPLMSGNQEYGMRAGTQNVAFAVGAAKAAETAVADRVERYQKLTTLKEHLIASLTRFVPDISFHGNKEHSIPAVINVAFFGSSNDTLLIRLDMDGIAVSKGAACSSETSEFSHVLLSMGIPEEEAIGSIRISLSYLQTKEDIDFLVQKLAFHVGQIRHMNITY